MKTKNTTLLLFAFTLFTLYSLIGFYVGRYTSFSFMRDNFGDPYGEQVFFFGFVTAVFEIVLFFFGIPLTLITMHQLGRRLKIAVGKQTFYGFLLYLLTLLILILYYNQTH